MASMGIHSCSNWAGNSGPYFWNLESRMKRKKKTAAPTISAIALYNLQRAEEAQTAHGGKSPMVLSSNVRFKRNLNDKTIR